MFLQQLRFKITNAQYETVSEILENAGALAVSLTDAKDQPIYEPELNSFPVWENAEISALFPAEIDLLNLIKDLNLDQNPDQYSIDQIENKNWERVCMDQFHPVKFGEKLWICPSWDKVSEPDAIIVDIDPGLAFGTGNHATTKLCLEWLATHDLKNKTIIDYGCGSGILAVAAAKLGATSVYAVDIDPQALHATLENSNRNHVSLLTLTPQQLPDNIQTDIIIANILANPLIHLAPKLISYLKLNGQIILSGILNDQIEAVQEAYRSKIKFESPVIHDEWVRLHGLRTRL